ncbi:MAG: SlyX family protein [Gammaproteobacteria bacterium]|nr:SlyX family protein [Gammaproteobacteria bacterium]
MTGETDRLEAAESKLLFQEDALQQLSDALVAQQARIDKLEARLKALSEQVADQADSSDESPDQPPPHY